MGNRAAKNVGRHGFHATLTGAGIGSVYTTTRPAQPAVHTAGHGAKPRPFYQRLASLIGWQPPKIGHIDKDSGKRVWKPRHINIVKAKKDD